MLTLEAQERYDAAVCVLVTFTFTSYIALAQDKNESSNWRKYERYIRDK